MPLSVTEISHLQSYVQGVMDRAAHHAGNVEDVVLALAGAIVWRKDSDAIRVMTRTGTTKNVLWVQINGRRYAFAYNHAPSQIEMRAGSTHGAVLHSFTNQTPMSEVRRVFATI